LTAGLIRPVGGSDVPAGGSLTDLGGAGERSGIPFVQSRVYYSRPSGEKTLTLGFSAHYGKEEYKTGTPPLEEDVSTWAVAGDFQIPLGSMFSAQGEIFTGSNLDSFQAGINQGIRMNPDSVTAIDTKGGWAQFSFLPPQNTNLTFNIAYGIDDPDDADLAKGQRSENATIMAGVHYKASKYFQAAFEYSRINTKYLAGSENDANVVNLAFGLWF
jgi:hypothetical protein